MTDTLYEVIFQGELVEGFSAADVKANIARLFKASPQQIEQMFSGRRVVIRNQLDQETAQKYQVLLRKNGALCSLAPMQPAAPAKRPAPVSPQPVTPAPSSSANAAPAPKPAASAAPAAVAPAAPAARKAAPSTDGRLNLAGKKADAILQNVDLELAPVGATLAAPSRPQPVEVPDLSHLTLAPVGATLVEHAEPPPAIVPDIDHLSVAPPGTRLSDPTPEE